MITVFGVVMGYDEGEEIVKPKTKHKPRDRVMIACRFCKKMFAIPPARLKDARYCSNPCRNADFQSHKRVTNLVKPWAKY